MKQLITFFKTLLDWLEILRNDLSQVAKSLFGSQWQTFRDKYKRLKQRSSDWWFNLRWWQFAKAIFARSQSLRLPLPMLAASLAYYAAFSLGPLLLIVAGTLGFILRNRPDLTSEYRTVLIDLLAQVMPLQENSAELAERAFDTLVTLLQQGALLNGIISLVFLIWVSSNFFASLQLALEIIFEAREQRGFWRKRVVALVSIGAVGLVIAFEVVGGLLITSVSELLEQLQMGFASIGVPLMVPDMGWGLRLISQVSRFVLAAITFTLSFRYLPRRSSSWIGSLSGGLFSVVALIVARQLLFLFFNIERFNLIYGIVTRLLAILLWLYLSLMLFLIGALITAHISQQRQQERDLQATP
jgi:membrane protein